MKVVPGLLQNQVPLDLFISGAHHQVPEEFTSESSEGQQPRGGTCGRL